MNKSALYRKAVRRLFMKDYPNGSPNSYCFPVTGITSVQYVKKTKNRIWFEVHVELCNNHCWCEKCLCFVRKKDFSSGIWENGKVVSAREKLEDWDSQRLEALCEIFGI